MAQQLLHSDITDKALRAYYNIYNTHGHDYPESYYEKMMGIELEQLGIAYKTQVEYEIYYKGIKVGVHISDMELENRIILENKAAPFILPRHCAQLVSYLKVSGKEVGLVLNFGGSKPEYKRRILTEIGQTYQPIWKPEQPIQSGLLYPALNQKLRHAVWTVYNELGSGFVHRIYGNALYAEIQLQGVICRRVHKMKVFHLDKNIGDVSFPYIIADETMIVSPIARAEIRRSDLNRVKYVMEQHGFHLGMVANFENEKLEIKYVR